MSARRTTSAVAALLLALLLTGCAGLPVSGPVVEAGTGAGSAADDPSDINAVPPRAGASPLEVAKGFLDAMTASPVRLDVARQYLTESAAQVWNPDAATITYAAKLPPRQARDGVVRVRLSEARLLDETGAYRGPLQSGRQVLDLRYRLEDGEYRLTDPPDALVVPAAWFSQRFRQASLYFFDRSARILVPEPVSVPRGEQLATALINGLLAGPRPDQRQVTRSFLPAGLSLGLSVPVSADGVAVVDLVGEAGSLAPSAADRLLAQLAWTLRQEPRITAVRVRVGGEDVQVPGGGTEYAVSQAERYDPAGFPADPRIFGLSRGRLGVLADGELVPVTGPFGGSTVQTPSPSTGGGSGDGSGDGGTGSGAAAAGSGDPAAPLLRSVAVSVDGSQAAGVDESGTRLLVAPVAGRATDTGAVVPIDDGTDLVRPTWDALGRVWVVDRTAEGAVVHVVMPSAPGTTGAPRRTTTVRVPGVTGRRVGSFLVSRDGTRVVAVARSRGGDEVRAGRVRIDERGRLAGVGSTTVIDTGPEPRARVVGLAWTTPTTFAVLQTVIAGEVLDVRTLRVDGSTTSTDSLTTTVPAPVRGLVGSPEEERSTYAVTPDGLVDLGDGAVSPLRGPVRNLGYVG